MSLDTDLRKAIKDELDYALKKGRGRGFWVRFTLYLKALVRIIKLILIYKRRTEGVDVKKWVDLLNFLRRVLSVLRP